MLRFLRYLRIVSSATCVIACVLLIVLWVRSYQTFDVVNGHLPGVKEIVCSSNCGRITLGLRNWHSQLPWSLSSLDLNDKSVFLPKAPRNWFVLVRIPGYLEVVFPHGFSALLTAAVAVVCWLPWSSRFSLRTLLIATTLVAVMLGLIVWMSR